MKQELLLLNNEPSNATKIDGVLEPVTIIVAIVVGAGPKIK